MCNYLLEDNEDDIFSKLFSESLLVGDMNYIQKILFNIKEDFKV